MSCLSWTRGYEVDFRTLAHRGEHFVNLMSSTSLDVRLILGYWPTLASPVHRVSSFKSRGGEVDFRILAHSGEERNPSLILCLSLPHAIGYEVDFRILAHRKEHKERPPRRQKLTLKPGNDFPVNGWSSRREE